MFEGRKVQTSKPFGEGGRKRCLVKEEALHLKEPDITSQAHFTKGFSRQSGFMDSGELQRQKKPHRAVTVVVLSIDDSNIPTLSYGTGISLLLGTAAIFAVWKRADNMSYHTPKGLNSLGS